MANEAASAPLALVTGGARRIGAEICRHLHDAGFDIALHYRSSAAAARQLTAEFNTLRPASCHCYQADLATAQGCAELARQVQHDAAGQLSLLVNNASLYYPTPLPHTPGSEGVRKKGSEGVGESELERAWDELLSTNCRAPWRLSLALREALAVNAGCVVNILDANTGKPQPGYAIYDMSKNALHSLTSSLALEFAPAIRVNAVAPGVILWPESKSGSDSNLTANTDNAQGLLETIPLRRRGNESDIASAVVYLATAAPYVTGQVLAVDGGRSLGG